MSIWKCPKCGGVPGMTVCCSGAQTARARHVPEASCGECGKKASDGWALYCVACMEEAGLPAQAVPLLSEAEVGELLDAARVPELPNGYEDLDMQIARAIEAAVRAKMRVAVPMTDEQVLAEFARAHPQDHTDMQDGSHTNAVERIGARAVYRRFERGIRAAEKFHGIAGKEGA